MCTELIAQYINQNLEEKYDIEPMLEIVDNYLAPLFAKFTWGYSVPYYLAAVNNCHPNYAAHLLNKQTVPVKVIGHLLKKIPSEKRPLFDRQFIEQIYLDYQEHLIDDTFALKKLTQLFEKKELLVLAPGKSIEDRHDVLKEYIARKKPFVVAVNFLPERLPLDMLFISNQKRAQGINRSALDGKYMVVTSNIVSMGSEHIAVNYSSLLNDDPVIDDNAGMMLLNLLVKCRIKKIAMAGFDGFSVQAAHNYYTEKMINVSDRENLMRLNEAIREKIALLSRKLHIEFLTKSQYLNETADVNRWVNTIL